MFVTVMKDSGFDRRYLYIAIIILLGLVLLLFFKIDSMSKAYSELASEYDSYRQETVLRINQLETNISSLKYSLASLNETYNKLSRTYIVLKKEVDSTIQKIDVYETELQESMEWFKTNSVLDTSEEQQEVMDYLEDDCFERKEDTCYIKTGCFYLVNSNKLGLRYNLDVITSGELDKLQSISEFIENKGGDCEDYSLFYKAEYNSVLEECGNIDSLNIMLEVWIPTQDSADWYELDFSRTWYLKSAREINMEEGYVYPNIICGSIYDLNSGDVSGHCVIVFTNIKIESKQDIDKFENAPIIEPQDGRYMGLVGDTSSGIYLMTEDNYKNPPDSYIYEIITDNDLFLFSKEHGEWLSYSVFDEELHAKKLELLNIKE